MLTTVADCYLFAVLNWSPYAGIELSAWPVLDRYVKALQLRPSIGKAVADEQSLFAEEQRRMHVPASQPATQV